MRSLAKSTLFSAKTSKIRSLAFSAVNPPDFTECFKIKMDLKPVYLPIWTTTPWTLPANEAVCLNPEIDYSLVDTKDSCFIIATDLVESAMARYEIKDYKIAGSVKGRVLEHLKLNHPFYARQVPVILGSHVTTESGTGCVHTAPAHGPDDYMVGKSYHLPLVNPVKANGCFSEEVELFAGLPVLKANDRILEVLAENRVLLAKDLIRHSYPHCWRHKSPMIFLATPQWFISMDKNNLRQAIVTEISQVNWVPDWGKARISNMVENRPDWCISRQRAWGTPMPLFVHSTTRELHPNTLELIEKVALIIEKSGIDAWFELDAAELLGEDAPFYDKISDTMDVWLDSGVSHFSVLKQNKELDFPADVYFEGSDQHRGWFNSSLTTSVAMYGVAPYKTVLTHGYTVDAEGKKLSKSKGNYVALDKLVNQHGADILRLWVASTDYRHEVSISDEIIKRNADAYRRIRNTARFLLANLCDFDPTQDCVVATDLLEIDKWAIKRCQLLQEEIITAYENFQFHVIYQKIHNFCAVDMGSFYLDLIKDRQYTTAKRSKARRSCQTAMYHIVHAFTLWLAPILSFTAEEIWQSIPGHANQSIFTECWYGAWPSIDSVNMADWDQLHLIRDEVNKALEETRQKGEIGSALAAEVTLYADALVLPKLTRLGEELRFLLITSGATVHPMSQSPIGLVASEYGVSIVVTASPNEKCARCWHRRPDIGQDHEHPELCLRCVGNISGQDEVRYYI
jgi:isoleucyl-tRNA synthetase